MSILEYTGLGLVLLAPVSLLMLLPLLSTGLRVWLFGWATVLLTSPLQVLAVEHSELLFLAQGMGVVFPMCLLAGSYGFLNRPVPHWIIYLALSAFGLRGTLAAADLVVTGRFAALPLEGFAYVFATWQLIQHAKPRQQIHVALGLSFLVMACVEIWDAAVNDQTRATVASGLPWVFAYVLMAAIQLWAWLDKARTESDASLRSARERFDALANHADDVIVEVNSRAEFVYVSPNCHKVLGISTQDMLGKHVDELMRLVSAEHQGKKFEFANSDSLQAIIAAGAYGTLYKVRHADGTPRFLEITASHYFNSKGEIRAVGVVRDITRRVEEEQSNLSRQKLESLGTMSAGIAHDFRNLLTTIRGSTELLQQDLGDSPAVQANTHIANILSASDQAAGLTHQLLTYAGKTPLVMDDIDLRNIILDSEPLLKTVIADRAHLYINLESEVPLIRGNRVAVQQILINLITNAVEALPGQDGKIWLSAAMHSDKTGKTMVDLKITDNGGGMEEATKAHIFEPFFTTKFAGRGLGLAAIQGLVSAHNGQIKVDSFPDQGATFTISLPASGQSEVSDQAPGG